LSPIQYKGESFLTLGGFYVSGFLVFGANNSEDVQSIKDKIDGMSWGEPNLDLQKHRVAPPNGSDPAFTEELVRRSLIFDKNSKATPIPYELFGDNCAAWVNTLFKVCGVPLGERIRAGQFRGIDAGERLEIPEELFEQRKSYIPPQPRENYPPPFKPSPGNGPKIHIVQPGDWLSKIAITYYGDMNKWTTIYNHPQNRQTIGPNPDLIKPGQKLVIP
jgi:nucleoid-associated protein YgaU